MKLSKHKLASLPHGTHDSLLSKLFVHLLQYCLIPALASNILDETLLDHFLSDLGFFLSGGSMLTDLSWHNN